MHRLDFELKRPWLLTPRGQRFSLHIANVVSLFLFLGFLLQFTLIEQPRTSIPQLNPAQVSYCELADCGEIFGVTLENGASAQADAKQTELGVSVVLEFTNTAMLSGRRELWIRLETEPGDFVEMASTWVEFDLKNRTSAEFLITGLKSEVFEGRLLLGY